MPAASSRPGFTPAVAGGRGAPVPQSLRETMRVVEWRDRRDEPRGRERAREPDRPRVNRERDRCARAALP